MIRQAALDKARRGSVRMADADAALLARVVDRDLRAFEKLYRLYHPRLTRFLFNMTRRPVLVEEG